MRLARLTSCSLSARHTGSDVRGACRGGDNLEDLYNRHFVKGPQQTNCQDDDDNQEGLSAGNFALALSGLWTLAVALVLREFAGARMRDRIRAHMQPESVVDHVHEVYEGVWDGASLDIEALVERFLKDDESHADLLKAMRRHYIRKDVSAWQKLIKTQKQLNREYKYTQFKLKSAEVQGDGGTPSDGSQGQQKLIDKKGTARRGSLERIQDLKQQIFGGDIGGDTLMQSIKVGASGEVIKQLLGQQEELLRKAIKQNVDEQHGRNVKLFGRAKTGVMRSTSQPPPGSSSNRLRSFKQSSNKSGGLRSSLVVGVCAHSRTRLHLILHG